MYRVQDWAEVHRLCEREGWSRTAIAVKLEMSRNTVDRLLELPLWEGDRNFLPLVFGTDGRPFHGVMPYRDGRPLSWNYSRV